MSKKTLPKLPKAFKNKWVKALLSGKYKQGNGALLRSYVSTDDEYCCLGVAGAICKVENMDSVNFFEYDLMSEAIKKGVPSILTGDGGLADKLSTFNDYGKSFKWIAAYIKRYL